MASDPRHRFGANAESLVADWLSERGFRVLGRNVRVGRLEIDIIATNGSVCAFVEVRARSSDEYGHPAETVTRLKQARVRQAAARWLRSQQTLSVGGHGDARFDVAALLRNEEGNFDIEYYENAF